jgi:hypothetical protein
VRKSSPRSRPERGVLTKPTKVNATAGLGLVALVLSACATSHTGVGVSSLGTQISFGVDATPGTAPSAPAAPTVPGSVFAPPTSAAPAAPAPLAPTANVPVVEPAQPTLSPAPRRPGFSFAPVTQAAGAAVTCPSAPPGASAKQVSTTVAKPPAEGSYRARYTVSEPVIPGSKVMRSSTYFYTLDITDVSPVTTTPGAQIIGSNSVKSEPTATFTFTETDHYATPDTFTVVKRWKVRVNAVSISERAGNVGSSVITGDPERGISLLSLTTKDGAGKVRTYGYATGLLLLPLDVIAGEQFTGSASDPATGTGDVVVGTITDTQRVDACGAYIDGWHVRGTEAISAPENQTPATQDVEYAFATQFGGIMTYSKVTYSDGQSVVVQLAQATPSPLGTARP